MFNDLTRREFVALAGASVAGGMLPDLCAANPGPTAPPHTLTLIEGSPRERGRMYGRKFAQPIRDFLEREIYKPFATDTAKRNEITRYAGACLNIVEKWSPEITEELHGVAEASDVSVVELVLMSLHEELYHRGDIPKIEHCTAVAVGPPNSATGDTYVGQTWDWMGSVFGMSEMLHWKRSEGPSLLSYAYPGLWVGAGMNSAGLALCWTSASDETSRGPRVGVPSYLLITQMMYQETLDAAVEEARRAPHAGWFTFVMGDGEGNLLDVEGSPKELAVEKHTGTLARVDYGSRQMTRTADGQDVQYTPRCRKMYELLRQTKGKIATGDLRNYFLTPEHEIYNPGMTIDAFIFNTTKRKLEITRGLGSSGEWQTFEFPKETAK